MSKALELFVRSMFRAVVVSVTLALTTVSYAQTEVRFTRGDVDANGAFEVTDAIVVLQYLFLGEQEIGCLDAADTNDTGTVEITDPIVLLNHLFLGLEPPFPPYPDCGLDPTPDDLGCEAFLPCLPDDGDSGLDARPSAAECPVLERPASTASFTARRVFPNLPLVGIVGIYQLPGDDTTWFAVRKTGFIYSWSNDDAVRTRRTLLDMSARVVNVPEGGLTSMAFDPQFSTTGRVYLFYTTPDPLTVRVSRFVSRDQGLSIDPASEEILISQEQASEYHHGGTLAFGPDGYLYIGLGESGDKPASQDTSMLLGSMLRIDVSGATGYTSPAGNPFAAGGGRPEIYAWGIRQPWRWSFDRATGDLWCADVGDVLWEEVNRVELGKNYGWPIREGRHCFRSETCDTTGLTDPVVEYSHDEGNAVIGGYVYRGSTIPELEGIYVYGDWGRGKVWGIYRDGNGLPESRLLFENDFRIQSFAEGNDGEVYILEGTKIFRLEKAEQSGGPQFPGKLSETGYVDRLNPREPAACMIPYEVNVPFWSDGAEKERWLTVPDGQSIHVGDDGDWEFPAGTVFMKSFHLGGKLIETRLLMRHEDGDWAGYSYEWDDAESDATLLSGEKAKDFGGVTWTYPSRSQCLQCHTAAAGRVLGLETWQMNRSILYPATGRTANQLATFEHVGLFDVPLGAKPEDLPVLPDPADEKTPLEERARSYLHANCSHCHRPGGNARGDADLRFDTPFDEAGICNVGPSGEDLGVPGSRLLAPGDPALSILSLRMHAADSTRMPPLGRNVVDDAGAALIDAWIQSIASCSADNAVILDNGEPGTFRVGNWGPSSAPNPYGPDSLYNRDADTTYNYDVVLPAEGTYEVDLWWTEWPSRISAVPVDITHATGTERVFVNQLENGGKWNSVGRWTFIRSARVTIHSLGGGSTCADAVRFLPATGP
jgi:uncharacterized repeat protein (TIGR03806 family)